MKSILIIPTLLISLLLVACGDDASSTKGSATKKESALEHAEKHLDPKYVCPMHPQIIKDEPGNCPICGMDLVPVENESAASSEEKKILYYRHPHKPTITSDKPMKDEMGMDYVPIYDDGASGPRVKINPAVVNNMGVRTAVVDRSRLWKRIDTVGQVQYDERRMSHIHTRTKGWIEKLETKIQGARVKKGDLLFKFYSPELVNAQEEYLQALLSGNRRLKSASKERLLSLGIDISQIKALEKRRSATQTIDVYAPQDGIVASLKVREGMFVQPMNEVMSLADLSEVWLLADVFERQSAWVKEGQPADVSFPYLPGQTLEGRVEYVYPDLDPKTRTLKVRLRFENPEEALKPNMYANLTIWGGPKKDVLSIPREALIRSGRDQRVIVAKGNGEFIPRQVVAGMETGQWVEIKEGLREGETVVISGQFLIDSEASLKASLMRMSSPKPEMSDASNMEGMSSEGMSASDSAAVMGHGTVNAIYPDQYKLNMDHDPIESLGWPSMTMDFNYKQEVDISDIQPGDQVMFELEKSDDGYVIRSFMKH